MPYQNQTPRGTIRTILTWSPVALVSAFLVFLLIILIAAMAVFGFGWFSRGTADYRGGTSAINQTKGNGKYRIASYDHFYDLCAAVQTDEAAIAGTEKELATKPGETRTSQLQTNLSAQNLKRADDINQYNADARKSGTVGQFRASDLPFQIDQNNKVTTCSAP